MKRQLFIFISLIVLILVLVGINAISYTKIEQKPDSEYQPNRSSYNSGATGTSAFYTLLTETRNKVVRWQQPPSALLSSANSKIKTLVLIGEPRRFVSDEEAETILRWVNKGGRLVLIDRFPNTALLKTGNKWKIFAGSGRVQLGEKVDPFNIASLTDKIVAAKPVQPTLLITGITAVQPSVLASTIKIGYSDKEVEEDRSLFGIGQREEPPPPTMPEKSRLTEQASANKAANKAGNGTGNSVGRPSSAPMLTKSTPTPSGSDKPAISGPANIMETSPLPVAPVIHLSNSEKDILADYPYGRGRIVFLTDPFIVSNAGIKLVDNATLAINIVSVYDGTIAFDEFHQGYGSENTFFRYFAGTPVPAILGQAVLLIFVLVWTRGRRFARPLPAPAKDRRSKLEYVAAMADLQQSTRAYDLAIENVYTQTKRDMVRLVGADNTISKKQLAEAVAERTGVEAKTLYKLMAKCEDIIHGEPTNAKETMNLISELRTLEEKLGLHRNRPGSAK